MGNDDFRDKTWSGHSNWRNKKNKLEGGNDEIRSNENILKQKLGINKRRNGP